MSPAVAALREEFVQSYLPTIQEMSARYFGRLNPEAREEAVAEITAYAWGNLLSAMKKGKRAVVAPSNLAYFASRGFRSGRRFAGSSEVDVMGEGTRALGRVGVVSLCAERTRGQGGDGEAVRLSDALADKRAQDPSEEARINVDYREMMQSRAVSNRAREVFVLLAQGHTTNEIAALLRVSAPRICQHKAALRRLLKRCGYGPSSRQNDTP